AHDLLSQLRAKGVDVKTSGDDRLVIDAPRGTVTEELRVALSANKADLIKILKDEAANTQAITETLQAAPAQPSPDLPPAPPERIEPTRAPILQPATPTLIAP